MKKIVMSGLVYSLPFLALAQTKIETDRPTEAQSAEWVTKGTVQMEIGLRAEKNQQNEFTCLHPNAVFRYGLLKRFEFRLSADLQTERSAIPPVSGSGLKPIEIGLKANVVRSGDSSFIMTVYGHIAMPTVASNIYEAKKTFYRTRLLVQNKLADKLKLTYNIGIDWNDEEQQQNWLYAVSPQLELSDKWLTFFESYGTIQKSGYPEHYVDGGLGYNLSKSVRLDVAAGKGLNSEASRYFVTTGFSVKL